MSLARTKPVTKRRVGRPTGYRPELGARIADAMATGLSLEAAAAECGIAPRTVFNWQNEYLEFLQAIEEGRARALLYWERLAIAQAHGAPGNAGIVSLALRNRSRSASGWVDKTTVEHAGTVEHKLTNVINVDDLDDEELDVLERALEKTIESQEREKQRQIGSAPTMRR